MSVKYKAQTLWAGRVWLDAKYLNESKNSNTPLEINYKGEKMTIQPDHLKVAFDKNKMVDSKFPPYTQRKQYGAVWTPN